MTIFYFLLFEIAMVIIWWHPEVHAWIQTTSPEWKVHIYPLRYDQFIIVFKSNIFQKQFY